MTQQPPKKSGLRTPMMTRSAAARRHHTNNNRHNHQNTTQSQNRSPTKSRVNPRDAFDKYSTLAKDALSQDDRVLAENYYQHAEHYYRLLMENRPKEPVVKAATRPAQQPQPVQPSQPASYSPVKMPTTPSKNSHPTYNADLARTSGPQPTFEQESRLKTPPTFLQHDLSEEVRIPPQRPKPKDKGESS